MLYLKLEGHAWQYEVEDVLRLFFYDEAVLRYENQPPEDPRGLFLFSGLVRRPAGAGPGGQGAEVCSYITSLTCSGVLQYESRYSLALSEGLSPRSGSGEAGKILKRELKRRIFTALAQYTGKKPPWGMLTGIRPAKLVHEMLESGLDKREIFSRLHGYYRVSAEKLSLLYTVAENESKILQSTPEESIGLYIGIPFCTTRCLYCSFTSNPIGRMGHLTGPYMEALLREMDGVGAILREKGYKIQSIYIGGGTPTALDCAKLERLLQAVEACFDTDTVQEYTLEAGRPDSIDAGKLETIKNSAVDRISINPQTMQDETLQRIGRGHTAEDVERAFGLARKMGFGNINMDIIAGLPGEDLGMFENTLQKLRELAPDSLTVHTLSVKRASRLSEEKEKYALAEDGLITGMTDLAGSCAGAMGLHPYYLYRQKNMLGNLENIGYCRPGYESIYNVQIMEEKQTILALGAGAITKVVYPAENRLERAFNVKNVEEYIQRLDEMLERKRKLL